MLTNARHNARWTSIFHFPFSISRGLFAVASIALLLTASGCSGVGWRSDVRGALDQAAKEGRMVVVWYWKPFNKDCDLMARTVFQSEDVIKDMQAAIPVRLHAAFSRKWGEANGLSEVPSFLAFGPDGQVLRRRSGVMDAHQFLAFLQLARLSP